MLLRECLLIQKNMGGICDLQFRAGSWNKYICELCFLGTRASQILFSVYFPEFAHLLLLVISMGFSSLPLQLPISLVLFCSFNRLFSLASLLSLLHSKTVTKRFRPGELLCRTSIPLLVLCCRVVGIAWQLQLVLFRALLRFDGFAPTFAEFVEVHRWTYRYAMIACF